MGNNMLQFMIWLNMLRAYDVTYSGLVALGARLCISLRAAFTFPSLTLGMDTICFRKGEEKKNKNFLCSNQIQYKYVYPKGYCNNVVIKNEREKDLGTGKKKKEHL